MFVIDVSATANLAEAKRFAFDLISIFSPQVVTGGKSAFGDALQLARQELIANGRRDAILVEILLTDGQNNTGRDPQGEAEVAKEAGIKIVSVGIGNLINRGLTASGSRRSSHLSCDTSERALPRRRSRRSPMGRPP
jgi:hypothetical protein